MAVTNDQLIQLKTGILGQQSKEAILKSHNSKLQELSGTDVGDTNLGASLGNVIPDNATVKQALQALEARSDISGSVDASAFKSVGNENTLGLNNTDTLQTIADKLNAYVATSGGATGKVLNAVFLATSSNISALQALDAGVTVDDFLFEWDTDTVKSYTIVPLDKFVDSGAFTAAAFKGTVGSADETVLVFTTVSGSSVEIDLARFVDVAGGATITGAEIVQAINAETGYEVLTTAEKAKISEVDKKTDISLFNIAASKKGSINYIVSGDSTRDNTYNEMIAYYTTQLAKINVAVFDNAESGQSGQNWKDNIGTATISQALAAIPGDGSTSILEFSFGINDSAGTEAEITGWLTEGLNLLLSAKPKLTVFLVTPVYTANLARNVYLKNIYIQLASDFGLELIDVVSAMETVHGNPLYYKDSTHPNKSGSRRLVNFILDKIVPASLSSLLTLEKLPQSTVELAGTPEVGLWNTATGDPQALSEWRRLPAITVEPGFTLKVQHQGNRTQAVFMQSDGTYIGKVSLTAVSGELYKTVLIPPTAGIVKINITSDAASWGLLNDIPSVTYMDNPSFVQLSVDQINAGFEVNSRVHVFDDDPRLSASGVIASGADMVVAINAEPGVSIMTAAEQQKIADSALQTDLASAIVSLNEARNQMAIALQSQLDNITSVQTVTQAEFDAQGVHSGNLISRIIG